MHERLVAWSLESKLVESEFLRRELGLEWQKTDVIGLITEAQQCSRSHRMVAVVASDLSRYAKVLRECPPNSICLVLLSDEAYRPETLRVARDSPAIGVVYRHYPVAPAGNVQILRELRRVIHASSGIEIPLWRIVPLLIRGLRSRIRMWNWRHCGKPVRVVPLGYTDKFASAFLGGRKAEPGASLFGADFEPDVTARPYQVTFRGNHGQLQRQLAIAQLRNWDATDIELVDGEWSGTAAAHLSGAGYVWALKQAVYAACPPGFLNNESFRYYEALICGANPIEDQVALTHLGSLPARPHSRVASLDERRALVAANLADIRTSIRRDCLQEVPKSDEV